MSSGQSKCCVCLKSIEPGAKKCTECGSYQDWTRYIFRYTSLATALLGVIPVITIAASLYQIAFAEKSADIRVALVRCDVQQLDIGITNVGEVPAIISQVSFASPDTPVTGTLPVIRRMDADQAASFLVDPKDGARVVSYRPYIGNTPTRFPVAPSDGGQCNYHITVESLQFDLTTKHQEVTCACSSS